ncbi:hypothetical protein FBU59_005577 [Linderina macrospora]|uniref:Uncharacterized protein n=1 Tax=Linderina macrospora TaxID=4868 RepID=A0ACC1J2G4_9FUNG|nr:hypothetical protein FBU59_005577 [Linderina macrospora]
MNRVLKPAAITLGSPLVTRRTVSVLLNERNKSQTTVSADTPTEDSSRITKVSRNLSNMFQSKQQPAPVDPRFEIIDSGYGSLVLAKMPAYSQFYAQVGQTLGQSPHVKSRATTKGAMAVAALKPLLGRRAFVQEISTEDVPADVLVAPRLTGDVSVIELDGSVDYFVRSGSLLAQTRFLNVSTWSGMGAGFNALAFDRVGGRGTAVVNTFGGMHRLVLKEGEEFLVDPRYVVAWTSSLNIEPQSGRPKSLKDAKSASSEAVKPVVETTSPIVEAEKPRVEPLMGNSPSVDNNVASPSKSPVDATQKVHLSTKGKSDWAAKILSLQFLQPAWQTIKGGLKGVAYASADVVRVSGWAAAKTVKTVAGVPDLYRVTGPGYIYVSTRLIPRPWTRLTSGVSK